MARWGNLLRSFGRTSFGSLCMKFKFISFFSCCTYFSIADEQCGPLSVYSMGSSWNSQNGSVVCHIIDSKYTQIDRTQVRVTSYN
jgi:hypothetical protein